MEPRWGATLGPFKSLWYIGFYVDHSRPSYWNPGPILQSRRMNLLARSPIISSYAQSPHQIRCRSTRQSAHTMPISPAIPSFHVQSSDSMPIRPLIPWLDVQSSHLMPSLPDACRSPARFRSHRRSARRIRPLPLTNQTRSALPGLLSPLVCSLPGLLSPRSALSPVRSLPGLLSPWSILVRLLSP